MHWDAYIDFVNELILADLISLLRLNTSHTLSYSLGAFNRHVRWNMLPTIDVGASTFDLRASWDGEAEDSQAIAHNPATLVSFGIGSNRDLSIHKRAHLPMLLQYNTLSMQCITRCHSPEPITLSKSQLTPRKSYANSMTHTSKMITSKYKSPKPGNPTGMITAKCPSNDDIEDTVSLPVQHDTPRHAYFHRDNPHGMYIHILDGGDSRP